MMRKRFMSSVQETFYFTGICFIKAKILIIHGDRLSKDKRMLIENLFYTLSNEAQYLESRQDGVSPDVIESKRNTVIVPDKFKADVEALENYIGRNLENGLCIKVDLAELLTVIPRERKRADAYNTLRRFLKNEFGVDLIINKKKQNDYE